MSEVEARTKPKVDHPDREIAWSPDPAVRNRPRPRRVLPMILTAVAVAVAAGLGWAMWNTYMAAPWTRDGTVRAYVVTIAPEVTGRIVSLPVADNQFVHKGDLLMVIDPTNYKIAVQLSAAAVAQADANMQNAEREAKRRSELNDLSVSVEQKQTYSTESISAQAQYQQALANLDQAKVNLGRTEIRSPVNGWVTNLLAQQGDYANIGQNLLSLVDADSFWVDGYFEETNLGGIQVNDAARIKLMGYPHVLRGHVDSIARAINVANAQPDRQGVASVNPIFTWVRLAQRIPVRIKIDQVPEGLQLSAGMTATVQIDPRAQNAAPPADHSAPGKP
jgi:RND family efflux transporter MFP subunit